jgi:sec-independent protein translocase protein TatC
MDTPKPFIEHIEELRSRFFWAIIITLCGTLITYYFSDKLIIFLTKPIDQPLYYTSPGGGFELVFKISVFGGIIFAIPFYIYQLSQFLKPVFTKTYIGIRVISISFVLTLGGMAFAYYICLPAALSFLAHFSSDQVKALISTNDYFTFISLYLLGFGFIFQLPLILFLINKITPLSVKKLFKLQRLVIILSFIFAAVLTPTPDIINQLSMALPIILLYQISIIIIWFSNRYMSNKYI